MSERDKPAAFAAPRRALDGGRFARWHLEPAAAPEEEGWLLTYLDVITLLLVMMVVMLSFSGSGKQAAPAGAKAAAAPMAGPEPIPVPDPLAGLLVDGLGANIEVVVNQGTLSFRIGSEFLFDSGEARLSATGLAVIGRLVPVLQRGAAYRVVVEGHTDNAPVQTGRFPSNWELSTGRAASVVRYLQGQGIEPARMRATGYADSRPVASNEQAQGRAANRRVEVTLESFK